MQIKFMHLVTMLQCMSTAYLLVGKQDNETLTYFCFLDKFKCLGINNYVLLYLIGSHCVVALMYRDESTEKES
jgi:hypothetical protein